MWSFRRGVDWAGDDTGATPLANNCFVDGLNGDDLNAGTPLAPFKTITQAKATFSSTYNIILAPYRYVDEYGTVGGNGDAYVIIGDSEDQDVIIVDSLGVRTGMQQNNCENVVLSGFLQGIRLNSNARIINCTFLNCAGSGIAKSYGCRFINTPLSYTTSNNSALNSCALLNSPLYSAGPFIIRGSYVDEQSTLNFPGTSTPIIQASHFENKITWDITGVNYATSNTDGDPFINDADLLNFSFDPLNSPLFGRGYPDGFSNPRHMARYYIGNGFYSGLTSFDDKVAANANLSVVANELLNVGTNDIEFIETDEITLSSLQAIGVPQKVGIISYLSTVFGLNPSVGNLDRVLEIRYADTDSGALSTYQQYRFGEQATNNGDGTGNGETGYNWADNNPIFVKKYQFRIGVVKAGVI